MATLLRPREDNLRGRMIRQGVKPVNYQRQHREKLREAQARNREQLYEEEEEADYAPARNNRYQGVASRLMDHQDKIDDMEKKQNFLRRGKLEQRQKKLTQRRTPARLRPIEDRKLTRPAVPTQQELLERENLSPRRAPQNFLRRNAQAVRWGYEAL